MPWPAASRSLPAVRPEWLQVPETYEQQAALNEVAEDSSVHFYVRNNPHYFALGQGRYWLKNSSPSYNIDVPGSPSSLPLPGREGTFRLVSAATGGGLLVQQAGSWQTQLRLALRAHLGSLGRLYGRNRIRAVDLPPPVELRASADHVHLHLHLFPSSLNREQFNRQAQYTYAAEGLLSTTP